MGTYVKWIWRHEQTLFKHFLNSSPHCFFYIIHENYDIRNWKLKINLRHTRTMEVTPYVASGKRVCMPPNHVLPIRYYVTFVQSWKSPRNKFPFILKLLRYVSRHWTTCIYCRKKVIVALNLSKVSNADRIIKPNQIFRSWEQSLLLCTTKNVSMWREF